VKEEALGVMCCVVLVALPIGLLIGAVILRGAVHFANKVLPKPVSRDFDDDWDDYERPVRRTSGGAIPDPALGKAMGIVFVRFIVGFIVSIPISLVLNGGMAGMGGRQDPAMQMIASLIQLPIGFLINAGILTPMLPTTFPRACLVVLFEYLIAIAIGLIIAVPLVVLAIALAGR
jgi:hypothetical protein